MTQRSLDILEKALALTEEERVDIAASLVESLDPAVDADAESAWQQEVARRVDQLNSGKSKTIPWEQVQAQISSRLAHDPKKD
jgi:putative addiction module component (TIGR02574 family)